MTPAALRGLWPLVAVTVLLASSAVASRYSGLRFTHVRPDAGETPLLLDPDLGSPTGPAALPSASPSQLAAAEPAEVPTWIVTAIAGLCVATVLVVLVLLVRQVVRDVTRRVSRPGNRRRRRSVPAAATAEQVVAALDAGLADLRDTDADPRRAVIACWVRLEEAAADAGVPRRPGDTPTDLVTRLLSSGGVVSADVLAQFAQVYRQARYASREVDERTRQQAREALRRLRSELAPDAAEQVAGA